jgi:hypothetical protein
MRYNRRGGHSTRVSSASTLTGFITSGVRCPMKRAFIGVLLAALSSLLFAARPQQWPSPPSQAAPPQQVPARADMAADPDSDWIPCARENQTCYTPGPAQVRFGGGGRYSAAKNAVGHIPCDIPTFGDPARRVEKLCEYKLGWDKTQAHPIREATDPDWVDCAREEEVCRFRGTPLVRFGIEGSYYYRTEHREIRCSVNEFGDPARRIPKTCQVTRDAVGRGGDRDERQGAGGSESDRPSNRWALCALEGEACRVSSPTVVRFGRDGDFNYRNVDNQVVCATDQFGDPTPGLVKVCEANTIPPERSAARRPAPDEIPPLQDPMWKPCAVEGQTCHFRGAEHVRFGARGVYRVIHAKDGLRCSVDTFGGDPTEGVPKRCDIYRP